MIDFIDPVLRASAGSKKAKKKYSFKHFALILLIIVIFACLSWLIYLGNFAILDTKPTSNIDVSDNIENIKFDGRIDPIQTNPGN